MRVQWVAPIDTVSGPHATLGEVSAGVTLSTGFIALVLGTIGVIWLLRRR